MMYLLEALNRRPKGLEPNSKYLKNIKGWGRKSREFKICPRKQRFHRMINLLQIVGIINKGPLHITKYIKKSNLAKNNTKPRKMAVSYLLTVCYRDAN